MELKTTSHSDGVLELGLKDEDISIGDIIRHELLKEKGVSFAGVTQPHPLLREVVLKLQTKGKKPMESVVACSERASKKAASLLKAVKQALEKRSR